MRKILFLLFIVLVIGSCDLLFNKDSGSSSPANDIAISSLTMSPSAMQGEMLEVEVQVKNFGIRDVNDEITITLTDQTQDSLLETFTKSGLASKDSVNFSYSFDTKKSTVGEHVIVASHNIEDDNVENDSLTSTLNVNQPEITDISISSINVPAMATQGETVDVEVNVENIGNEDVSEAITVELADDTDDTDGTTIDTKTISGGLAAGNKAVLSFTWNTSEVSVGDHTLVASHNFDDENADNNSQTSQVAIKEAQVTDIAVTEVSGPSSVDQGENAEVSVTLENLGNQDVSETFSLTLTDQTDGTQIATQSVSGLAEGESTTLTFDWDTDGASVGDHTLVASHNLDDGNSDNDSGSTTIKISFLDLTIESVDGPSSANQGEEVSVSVQLRNQGNQNINSDVEVTLTDETDGSTIGTQTISGGLNEGASTTLTFTWDTEGASIGDHNLVATHDLDDDNGDNDAGSKVITINIPPFLDIAVTEVNAPASASRGGTVNVEVVLRNQGNRDIGEDIEVTLTDENSSTTIETLTISGGLAQDASTTLTFTWDTNGFDPGFHTLVGRHNFEDDNINNDSESDQIFIF